jgi:hypothetical protein
MVVMGLNRQLFTEWQIRVMHVRAGALGPRIVAPTYWAITDLLTALDDAAQGPAEVRDSRPGVFGGWRLAGAPPPPSRIAV